MNLIKLLIFKKEEPLFDCLGNMRILETDSRVTRIVKDTWNKLTEDEFFACFSCSKDTYKRRVIKYGDPYMNSPLAKIGKKLSGIR